MWYRLFSAAAMVVLLLAPMAASAQGVGERIYELGTGDRLRVIVYGEEDLSGEFEVGSQGTINLPLIGEIDALGLPISAVEDLVEAQLGNGYLVSPSVSIEVLNYRPFYILGEVNNPGSYPYVNGMTVLTAVALAGGFTYRADEDDIVLSRSANGAQTQVAPDTALLPGDILRVEERFF